MALLGQQSYLCCGQELTSRRYVAEHQVAMVLARSTRPLSAALCPKLCQSEGWLPDESQQRTSKRRVQTSAAMTSMGQPDIPGSAGSISWKGLTEEEIQAYLRMARLHNTLPAFMLVLLGAWVGAGRDPSIVSNLTVWFMGAISAGVSAASMVINDYFDWVSGTDKVNSPHKPLPAGLVKPDMAVLMAGSMYIFVLIAACSMDNPAIRGIIAFSAGATLLYTPVFKRVTMVKNALVACVIALAPLTGALAAGASTVVLQRLAVPCGFAFTAIMYREVLMDCADAPGDRAANVRTLPVTLGPGPALALATTLLLIGAVGGLTVLLTTSSATSTATALPSVSLSAAIHHAMHVWPGWPALMCASTAATCVGQIVQQVFRVHVAGYTLEAINKAVDDCMKPMGLAIILLAAMA